MKYLFVFMGLLALGSTQIFAKGKPGVIPNVFSVDVNVLIASKKKIENKDPFTLSAYKELLKQADKALKFGPVSVMEKNNLPPSGDKHDYTSLAPYHWPDSNKPNGLPYIRKDGQVNPEVKEYQDKNNMPTLCDNAFILSLAWYYSGEKKYAEHAAKLIKVWFLDTATRMNPNLNYAQMIKGVNTGRGAGLIDVRHFSKVIDAIGLLNGSEYWNVNNEDEMKTWFAKFLEWMQTSDNGLHEMKAANNHGAWYDALRLSISLFTGNTDLAKDVIKNAEIRLDKQMDANGNFPLELERTNSLHYTVFVMDAFTNIAQMAPHAGIDFSGYTSPSGKSLKKAFEELLPYLLDQKKWIGPQIKVFDFKDAIHVLKYGERNFGCKECRNFISKTINDNSRKELVKLLY